MSVRKLVKIASVLVTVTGAGLVAYAGLGVASQAGPATPPVASSYDLVLVVGGACIALGLVALVMTERSL
jgi:hypothetical protein